MIGWVSGVGNEPGFVFGEFIDSDWVDIVRELSIDASTEIGRFACRPFCRSCARGKFGMFARDVQVRVSQPMRNRRRPLHLKTLLIPLYEIRPRTRPQTNWWIDGSSVNRRVGQRVVIDSEYVWNVREKAFRFLQNHHHWCTDNRRITTLRRVKRDNAKQTILVVAVLQHQKRRRVPLRYHL